MTPTNKYEAFLLDLADLYVKHQVILSTSGYDMLQVWDLDEDDSPEYDFDHIEDKTK